MANPSEQLAAAEDQFLTQLRRHPELADRLHALLRLADSAQQSLVPADDIEAQLIVLTRQIGRTTLTSWATQGEAALAAQFRREHPRAELKKRTCLRWYSVYGPITVSERVWRDAPASYQRLLPAAIGVTARGCSRPLQRVLTDFGSDQSFAQASRKVLEHYGFEINCSAVRKATLECAQKVALQLTAEAAAGCRALPAATAPTLIVEADGSMVCTRPAGPRKGPRPLRYEEIRLAAAQAHGSTTTTYAASFESVADLGQRWGCCAQAAGRGVNSAIHALGDGAGWIVGQVTEIFGRQATFLCDFFHVKEYLRAAAPSCRAQAPDQWRRTQQRRLKRNALEKVIAELEARLETAAVPNEDAPVRAVHRYLDNRRDQFDYAGALARDLPIGSGLIESGNRHVLQARLKLPGCSWHRENAADMAQLRVFRANQRYPQFWN